MSRLWILAAVAVLSSTPALAQDRGCDIQTSSYVRIVPPNAPKSAVIVAAPQTPCPVLDTGPQQQIGPIAIEIKPTIPDPVRPRPRGKGQRRLQSGTGADE